MQLLLLTAFLVLAILFILTQQNTLKAIKPGNQLMNPGMVWLQLIPIFNFVWQFIVVSRIAGSIRNEVETRDEDSVLGIADAASVKQLGNQPTFGIGVAYCVLITFGIVINSLIRTSPSDVSVFALFGSLCTLAGTVCWIVYWVRLSLWKKRILGFRLNPEFQGARRAG